MVCSLTGVFALTQVHNITPFQGAEHDIESARDSIQDLVHGETVLLLVETSKSGCRDGAKGKDEVFGFAKPEVHLASVKQRRPNMFEACQL